jgi:hypothetical protein
MPTSPAKTDIKQNGQFKPGQSGNPIGRPHGSRNKATLALEALLDDEGEAITRKARVIAQSGVLASDSSGDQIDVRHLNTVFELCLTSAPMGHIEMFS